MLHFKLLPVCLTFYFFTDISAFKFSCSFHNSEHAGNDYAMHDNEDFKWTNDEVPYVFDENTFTKDQTAIKEQMDVIESNVPCIKFIEKTKENVPQKHLKIIIYNQKSCDQIPGYISWSLGGQVNNNYSPRIDLISGTRLADCDDERYKKASGLWIIHELMHVFGIEHTQKRSDRDEYIEVYDRCIKNGSDNYDQYKKLINYPDISFRDEVPYRCDSVMHYEPDNLSIDEKNCPTMENKTMDCVFGAEEVLPEDWMMLRKHIGCTGSAISSSKTTTPMDTATTTIPRTISRCSHKNIWNDNICELWAMGGHCQSQDIATGRVINQDCAKSCFCGNTPGGCPYRNFRGDASCDMYARAGHCNSWWIIQDCAKSCRC